MKKTILYLMISIGFLGSKQALAMDTFEVGVRSDGIVGRLWQGHEVPERDIENLFELIKADNSITNKKESNVYLHQFVSSCNEMMKETAEHRNKNEGNINNINNFIGKVRGLTSKFDSHVIENGLYLILSKYE